MKNRIGWRGCSGKDKAKKCCRLLIKQAGRQTHDKLTLHVGQNESVNIFDTRARPKAGNKNLIMEFALLSRIA